MRCAHTSAPRASASSPSAADTSEVVHSLCFALSSKCRSRMSCDFRRHERSSCFFSARSDVRSSRMASRASRASCESGARFRALLPRADCTPPPSPRRRPRGGRGTPGAGSALRAELIIVPERGDWCAKAAKPWPRLSPLSTTIAPSPLQL